MDLPLLDVIATYWSGPASLLPPYGPVMALIQQLVADRNELASRHRQLRQSLEAEQKLARTDPLTMLPNRRLFMDTLARAVAQTIRDQSSLSVAYLDLDNFKRVNDLYGHAAGDALLRQVAAILDRVTRGTDLAARLGGDEFALLFHRSTLGALKPIGRRLVRQVGALAVDYPNAMPGVSIGFAHFDRPPRDTMAIVRRADEAMYEAKLSGRGEIIVWAQRPGLFESAGGCSCAVTRTKSRLD